MNIYIREAQQGDWKDISRIYQEGMDTNIATFQTSCPSYEEWDNSRLKVCRLVICVDNHIAGWAALSSASNRCVYAGVAESSIYMDKGYQGMGLGSRLLSGLVEKSEEAGFWTLQSVILEDNIPSIELHKKCGFRVVGYREKIGCDRFGKWKNTILMEKRSQKIGI